MNEETKNSVSQTEEPNKNKNLTNTDIHTPKQWKSYWAWTRDIFLPLLTKTGGDSSKNSLISKDYLMREFENGSDSLKVMNEIYQKYYAKKEEETKD
jgi:hypothetical protein